MSDLSGHSTNPSLLRAIAEGASDSLSWPIFVEKYGPILARWCHRWGASPQDTEDIVQECLIVVFRRLDTYRSEPRSNFRSWLKTVAYRIWLQLLEIRERNLHEPEGQGIGTPENWDLLGSQEARDDLTRRLDAMADREILELASSSVREQVEPLTWVCFEKLNLEDVPGKDVAAQLGINPAAVFTNACRVRKLLKREIERLESE